MGSLGQRALKLLAVKVGGLKKKSLKLPFVLNNQRFLIYSFKGFRSFNTVNIGSVD